MTARRVLLATGLAVWIANAVIVVATRVPLGHDESEYANAASGWLAGEPARLFYLSPGMDAIAAPGILLGGSDLAMRLVPALIGLGFIASVWLLARRVAGADTAAWAVWLLAASRPFTKRTADLLSDLPAATCLVLATWIVITELSREHGPRWRLVAAAPLGAAALYVRYGSCVPIALIATFALAFGWPALRRRPGPALATAGAFLALLVPHAISAVHLTGSPLGILLESSTVPGESFAGSGLTTYLTGNPIQQYGLVLAPVLVIAVVSPAIVRDREPGLAPGEQERRRRCGGNRARLLIWALGIGHIVVVGLVTIAQTRYIFFGLALLAIVGADAIRKLVARSLLARRVAAGGAVLALGWSSFVATNAGRKQARVERHSYADTLAAAAAIRTDAAGAACQVFGRHDQQLAWYSGCDWPIVFDPAAIPHVRVYAVRDTRADPGELDLDSLPGHHAPVLDDPLVRVIRLDPAPSGAAPR
jgi:4-amino-4-deoxy-L-arabinose transferase-like glycosyltransferase